MIAIKPHHFVDIVTVYGDGRPEFRPHPYGHAVHIVSGKIISDRDIVLRIELGADDVCAPCRHNINGVCDDLIDISYRPQAPQSKREWNLLIDRRWCKRLGLGQGDCLTARELCERIRGCVGDITDIYREIPRERADERRAKLQEGIRTFLEE